MKRIIGLIMAILLCMSMFSGCGSNAGEMSEIGNATEAKQSKKAENAAVEIKFGNYASAAILENGKAYVWGDSYPGNGKEYGRHSFGIPEFVMDNVVDISVCETHSALVTKSGELYMWGANGQHIDNSGELEYHTPKKIMDGVKKVFVTGKSTNSTRITAVIKDDGALYWWGSGYGGDSSDIPVKLLDNVKQAAFRDNGGGMAVTNDGGLYVWGRTAKGDGSQVEFIVEPVKVMDGVRYCDENDMYAIVKDDNSLYVWLGYKGDGTEEKKDYEATKVMDNVKSVCVTDGAIVALTNNGEVYTWGENEYGQLGDGTYENRFVPQMIMENVSSISAADGHCGAITNDGELYTWGYNCYGQLGIDAHIKNRMVETPQLVIFE